MIKHLFIVNPAAGGQDQTEAVSALVSAYFAGRPGSFEVYTTAGALDARDKVRREAAQCAEVRVYACGGDGTLNECVSGAAECRNVAVGCYPTGTGNDFIKLFGEKARGHFANLAELIEGKETLLDLIACNERWSLNICSVGIDARIGADVHKYSRLPLIGGAAGYVSSLLVNYFKGITDEMRVLCNGRLSYGKTNLVCICNGQYYGGGFRPVPEARADDGVLEVLIVKGVSRLRFPALVLRYARGGYASLPRYVTHLSCQRLTIEGEKPLTVNLDGETLRTQKLEVRVLPRRLRFLVPACLQEPYF